MSRSPSCMLCLGAMYSSEHSCFKPCWTLQIGLVLNIRQQQFQQQQQLNRDFQIECKGRLEDGRITFWFQLACGGCYVFPVSEGTGSHWIAWFKVLLWSCAVNIHSKTGCDPAQHLNAVHQFDRLPWVMTSENTGSLQFEGKAAGAQCFLFLLQKVQTQHLPIRTCSGGLESSWILNEEYLSCPVSGASASSLKCGTLNRALHMLQLMMYQMQKSQECVRFIDGIRLAGWFQLDFSCPVTKSQQRRARILQQGAVPWLLLLLHSPPSTGFNGLSRIYCS